MFKLGGGTVGARFTILYAVVFLLSGAGLLGLAVLLSSFEVTTVAPPGVAPPGLDGHAVLARQLAAGSLLALVVMAVVSLVVGRVLAKRVLRPLRLVTRATRRITAESLDRRLAVAGPADEVKDLADTIDGLLARLETSFTAQRRFVANASHELRTPLATMRASLDVAVAKPQPAASTVALADRLRPQLDRVDHLLDGFLVLARAQHGALTDVTDVDLGKLVGESLHERAAGIEAGRLTVHADAGSVVRGSSALLTRLVDNLVDNAVKHNVGGGRIEISGHPEGGLIVETSGPVLDQQEVDRLAQPFERLGDERTGSSGLGLSIVASIAVAHGGRLDLTARREGGLRVAVVLP
ncbi:ATP-binding protein, partial [Actinoplanes sp. NPDC051633]|uniref:sensor histidine kinase n=1 Tax=Actinoplanes sp. NPDC051633 TaxID=3155670 RepID=UPI00343780BF